MSQSSRTTHGESWSQRRRHYRHCRREGPTEGLYLGGLWYTSCFPPCPPPSTPDSHDPWNPTTDTTVKRVSVSRLSMVGRGNVRGNPDGQTDRHRSLQNSTCVTGGTETDLGCLWDRLETY